MGAATWDLGPWRCPLIHSRPPACPPGFAELQTDMTDLTKELNRSQGIPFLEYKHFVTRTFFPKVRAGSRRLAIPQEFLEQCETCTPTYGSPATFPGRPAWPAEGKGPGSTAPPQLAFSAHLLFECAY